MDANHGLFEPAQKAFNTIRIMRGQLTSIATCDVEGNPNVAPIGSMRVVDSSTVHVLQGYLPRTIRNLKANPKAAFSVTLPLTFGTIFSMLRSPSDAPGGYRVYCELTSIDDDRVAVEEETKASLRRMPWVLRGAFARFCEKNLKQLLRFRILEIRPT
jgi:hypothetical protein